MTQNNLAPDVRAGRTAWRLGLAACLFAALAIWTVWLLWQTDFSLVPLLGFVSAVCVSAISLLTAAWRMTALSRRRVSMATGCKSIALVSSLLIVFPSRLSDLIKPVYLSERAGLDLSAGFSILFYERALDVFVLLGMLVLLVLGQGTAAGDGILRSTTLLSFIGLALIALIGVLIVRPALLQRAARGLPLPGLRHMATQFLSVLSDTSRAPVVAWAGVLSLLAWANSYLIFYVYLVSLNTPDSSISVDALSVLLVFVAGALGLFVTVTPGGIGTYELAIALALSTCGVPITEGLIHGLLLRVIVLLPNLLLLIYVVAYDGLGLRSLYYRIGQMRRARMDAGNLP